MSASVSERGILTDLPGFMGSILILRRCNLVQWGDL